MYYDEQNPPHFFSIYAELEAWIGISPISLLEGQLPRRALGLVVEWAVERQQQLSKNWRKINFHQLYNSNKSTSSSYKNPFIKSAR
jgi:hypothetical protein